MLLPGKVCLITGAADGIGKGIATRFAAEGAAIGVLDYHAAACAATAAALRAAGARALALLADVRDPAAVAAAVQQLAETFGPPTVLVHNAAVMPSGGLDETPEADWDVSFAVNVKGAYVTSRSVLPHMRVAGGGVILFTTSITAHVGLPGLAAYSATKGALLALARAMAIDYAAENIRVNTVSPGTIDSPMLHRFVNEQADPAATRAAFDAMYPRGRVGTIEEVAAVFAFLASDQASFVSGADYRVDGAMSVKSEQPRL
jgi:NAD(P)-dependent dehydrogenase (short-subunit alcohol dehydrogenase family)